MKMSRGAVKVRGVFKFWLGGGNKFRNETLSKPLGKYDAKEMMCALFLLSKIFIWWYPDFLSIMEKNVIQQVFEIG